MTTRDDARPRPSPDRYPLLHGPTPLHELPRLRAALGGEKVCPRILIKRDDLAGPALGGNKARKLEYMVADALARGATHLITVGAVQSNHARMTAAAASMAGLRCVLVLTAPSVAAGPAGRAGEAQTAGAFTTALEGNLILDMWLGAELRIVPPSPEGEAENPHEAAAIAQATAAIEADGGRAYVIPTGGSTPLGTLGYVDGVGELQRQLLAAGEAPVRAYFAAGSRGTQAGMVLGARLHGAAWEPHGVAVSPGDPDKTQRVVRLANEAAELIGSEIRITAADVVTHQEYIGPGYGVPTAASHAAIRLLARTEGVFLDPVYTSKAFAGLLDHIRQGDVNAEATVVFIHTGGAPALFTATHRPETEE